MREQAKIEVQADANEAGTFLVTVIVAGGQTAHRVTVQESFSSSLLRGGRSLEDLVRVSFEFLLEREPTESIMQEFDLAVISRYFPEYEDQVRERLR